MVAAKLKPSSSPTMTPPAFFKAINELIEGLGEREQRKRDAITPRPADHLDGDRQD